MQMSWASQHLGGRCQVFASLSGRGAGCRRARPVHRLSSCPGTGAPSPFWTPASVAASAFSAADGCPAGCYESRVSLANSSPFGVFYFRASPRGVQVAGVTTVTDAAHSPLLFLFPFSYYFILFSDFFSWRRGSCCQGENASSSLKRKKKKQFNYY